jgi:hypothetical protein
MSTVFFLVGQEGVQPYFRFRLMTPPEVKVTRFALLVGFEPTLRRDYWLTARCITTLPQQSKPRRIGAPDGERSRLILIDSEVPTQSTSGA